MEIPQICSLIFPRREGSWEAEGREEGDHFIIKHQAIYWSKIRNIFHSSGPTGLFVSAPFSIHQCEWKFLCSSLSLCCFWTDHDWNPIDCAWSSVCLWYVKFFQNTLFSRRLSQQPAVTVNGLSLFLDRMTLSFVCAQVCADEFIRVLQESCVWDFVNEER